MSDTIKWKILKDGTVSIETDRISGENHVSADKLLESLTDMVGGPVSIEDKRGKIHKSQHARHERPCHH